MPELLNHFPALLEKPSEDGERVDPMQSVRSARPVLGPRPPRVADLFAGAGGFSFGAFLAGAEIIAAVENNVNAAETYRRNLVGNKEYASCSYRRRKSGSRCAYRESLCGN